MSDGERADAAHLDRTTEERRQARLRRNWAAGLAAVALVVVVWVAWPTDEGGEGAGPTHSAATAQVLCENAVKERLKSPASADFSGVSSEPSSEGGWNIDGDVDAENEFGAALRHSFACHVKPDTEPDKYLVKVTSLTKG